MPSRRKLLRPLSLVCGVLLIAASPFFIFHTEETHYPYPYYASSNVRGMAPPPGIVYQNLNSCYILFGGFLFMAGLVLIVASYYRHDELRLVDKI